MVTTSIWTVTKTGFYSCIYQKRSIAIKTHPQSQLFNNVKVWFLLPLESNSYRQGQNEARSLAKQLLRDLGSFHREDLKSLKPSTERFYLFPADMELQSILWAIVGVRPESSMYHTHSYHIGWNSVIWPALAESKAQIPCVNIELCVCPSKQNISSSKCMGTGILAV